jgi:ribokinase
MQQKSVLVVGSLNMDQVVQVPRLPVAGETLLGTGRLRLVPGGKGANQAVAIARLGAPVAMAGRVGRDPFGERLLQALRTAEVDHRLVEVDEEQASGTAFIFLVPEGENAIIVAPGANMQVGADHAHLERIEQALAAASALVLQMEIPLQTVETLIHAAHRASVPVILNAAPAQVLSADALRQVDTLIVNEQEALTLATALQDSALPASGSAEDLEAVRAVAMRLHEHGVPSVVVTLGSRGALLVTGGLGAGAQVHSLHEPAPRVEIVDTTAAGDCFVGAFTVALLEQYPPESALRFAVYASALKVTRFGAQSGLPERAAVEAFLQR